MNVIEVIRSMRLSRNHPPTVENANINVCFSLSSLMNSRHYTAPDYMHLGSCQLNRKTVTFSPYSLKSKTMYGSISSSPKKNNMILSLSGSWPHGRWMISSIAPTFCFEARLKAVRRARST